MPPAQTGKHTPAPSADKTVDARRLSTGSQAWADGLTRLVRSIGDLLLPIDQCVIFTYGEKQGAEIPMEFLLPLTSTAVHP